MKAILLNLREKQLADLKNLAAKTGAPVSELIRRAIDEYLKKRTASRGSRRK